MQPPLNCSSLSQSHIETTMDRTEALGVLEELCRRSRASDSAHISTAVQGILGSLLTCGLLLSLFFFIFTVRFRQNRIVKMSSPNLNLLILAGSFLMYISAFMYAAPENAFSMPAIIQVRISLLYVGASLVFGPLLGKSWRLHRVFTHRVPDKRVIIKDLTLLAMQAALIFIDSVLLLAWVLSDPILCAQNVNASIKAAERGTHCAVTRSLSCSSLYTDFWVTLLLGFKAVLLVYGSYLAGLTKNISSPPVNQSLVIMVGTTLVIVATAIVLPVTRFFHTWPSLVYGVTSGSILACTATINGLIFIPQVLQWKQYEEEASHTTTQMAKYFSSPSRSMRSMYSEEQIYQLLGENNSMRRMLTEKNAMIDSLQEQVANAKEKLVQLLKSEYSIDITEVTALSASTLNNMEQQRPPSEETTEKTENQSFGDRAMDDDTTPDQGLQDMNPPVAGDKPQTEEPQLSDLQPPDCPMPEQDNAVPAASKSVSFVAHVSKPQSEMMERGADGACEVWERLSRKVNYVSCEKLQEVLRELSVEALPGSGQMSPRRLRRASHSFHREPAMTSTGGFQNVSLSLSPYMARRRRGFNRRTTAAPSHSSREMLQQGRWMGHHGVRDRCKRDSMASHVAELELNETTKDIQSSSTGIGMEMSVELEGKGHQENGGLWVTRLSESSDFARPSIRVGGRSESPFSESDTSSSGETLCYCHRPYCDICSPDMCETSDTETDDQLQVWPKHLSCFVPPVVNFNEDLPPTFV
ncbi:probable G-protein coupled receptor 156 [Hyperolius riggenbachi]|uniref:probable G-protein coupled receptor 156 n=1 Tax=Hyperolius riggenbachi TaxID=752182 RepID=UPI0035A3BDDC